jgi:hypothetical protein
MTTTTLHPLAADYLERLERAARRLPRGERRELVEEIGAHLAEATDADMSDAEALSVLDRLGDPEEIVDAQLPTAPARPDRRGLQEWAAIFLLLFGGFAFGLGWILGLILLWSSSAWSARDKLIGTLIVPGGLATAFVTTLQRRPAALHPGAEHDPPHTLVGAVRHPRPRPDFHLGVPGPPGPLATGANRPRKDKYGPCRAR